MGVVVIVAFLVLIGPLSVFFGVDSRRSTGSRLGRRGTLVPRVVNSSLASLT